MARGFCLSARMISSRWTALTVILALLLGLSGNALAKSLDQSPEDESPFGQPFEEDKEKETKSEVECDDETALMFVVPVVLPTAGAVHQLNEDRPGTVASATHALHAPRAPPASRS